MENKIEELKNELLNKGLSLLEVYDVMCRDMQLVIDKLRQDRKKVLTNTINNLDQVSIDELGE